MQLSPREFDEIQKRIKTACDEGYRRGQYERAANAAETSDRSLQILKAYITNAGKLIAEHRGVLLARNPGVSMKPPVVNEIDMETERVLNRIGMALNGQETA